MVLGIKICQCAGDYCNSKHEFGGSQFEEGGGGGGGGAGSLGIEDSEIIMAAIFSIMLSITH